MPNSQEAWETTARSLSSAISAYGASFQCPAHRYQCCTGQHLDPAEAPPLWFPNSASRVPEHAQEATRKPPLNVLTWAGFLAGWNPLSVPLPAADGGGCETAPPLLASRCLSSPLLAQRCRPVFIRSSPQVNTQLLVRRYRAGTCSGAWCFCAITVVGSLLIPLFFALATGSETSFRHHAMASRFWPAGWQWPRSRSLPLPAPDPAGFWAKEFVRYEQPDLLFDVRWLCAGTAGSRRSVRPCTLRAAAPSPTAPQNDVLISAVGEQLDASGLVLPLSVAYSTSSRAKELLGSSLRAPSVMRVRADEAPAPAAQGGRTLAARVPHPFRAPPTPFVRPPPRRPRRPRSAPRPGMRASTSSSSTSPCPSSPASASPRSRSSSRPG